VIALLAAVALAAPVNRYAVVIGADRGRVDEEPLRYAERDAERVADVLTRFGDVPAADLVLLRGRDADQVREVLAEVAERVARDRARGDQALMFVYYSGHADAAALHLDGSDLPLTELKEVLEAVPVDMRVLVVDACQSGELTRLKGMRPAEPFHIEVEGRLDSEGMAIITSSSPGEDAQESDRLRGGVFSHHLVSGLLGAADASGDARVTLSEAFQYARSQTIRSTSQARFVQHPTFDFDVRGGDELVLTRLQVDPRAGQLTLEAAGTYLVFDARDDGELHAEVTVPAGGALALSPGDYLVRLREADAVREGVVSVQRGTSLLVRRDDLAAVPYGETVRRGLSEERRSAWALTLGGGLVGPVVPEVAGSPLVGLGARVDLEPLSVGLRVHGTRQQATNQTLSLTQDRLGADVQLVKWLDLGPVVPGVGVRGGGDLVAQRFDTAGEAPARQGLVGRVGPVLGLEVPLSPRTAVSLSGGADVQVYRDVDGAWASLPVPHVMLEGVAYVW